MLTTLPWWAWLLSGAGCVALIWLVVALALSRPRRQQLALRLDEQRQQIEHLGTQRADREARVSSIEARLAESEHLRLAAETSAAERATRLDAASERLRAADRLEIELAALHERIAAVEEDERQARERARTLESQREQLLNDRDQARSQHEASERRRESALAEAERLREQLAEQRYAAELHAAQLRVAEGEHEANALAALRSRQLHTRSADLVALSAFAAELAEYRIALKQARRRLDQLRQNPEAMPADTAAAAALGAEISARSADVRAMAAQFQLIADPADLLRGDLLESIEADEPQGSTLTRDLLGYLRDTFGRLPFRVAPSLQPLPEHEESAPAEQEQAEERNARND